MPSLPLNPHPLNTAATKWLAGIPPDNPLAKVAIVALDTRLAAIRLHLPLAAQRASEDHEHVHQLRVWTRRCAAAFDVFAECLPRRRAARVKRQLKRLRRAASDARDLDVILLRFRDQAAHPAAESWLNKLQSQRDTAQRPLVVIHKRLTRAGRFDRRIERLFRRIRQRETGGQPGAAPFGSWAQAALRRDVADFFAAVPNEHSDLQALHAFRIQGKRLRYAIELLAAAFPPLLTGELYPIIESIQTRLGNLNDAVTLCDRLPNWIAEADSPAEADYLRELLCQEQARLEPMRLDFLAWFATRLERLRLGFALLDASDAESPSADRSVPPAADSPTG